MPTYRKHDLIVRINEPQAFAIHCRIPDWIMSEASVYVNGVLHGKTAASDRFYSISRVWQDGDKISLILPIGIRFIPLPDDENTGAFRFGPEVLAGIGEAERIMYIDGEDAASEIEMGNEREWGSWRFFFKTVNQDPSIPLRRIRDIGYESYQIYFKVKKSDQRPPIRS